MKLVFRHLLFSFPLCAMAFLSAGRPAAAQERLSVSSPDGRQRIELSVQEVDGATSISYSTWYDGREVILPSRMDLSVDNHVWEHALGKRWEQPRRWFDNLELAGCDSISRDTTWHNPYGERSEVRDAYNGLVAHFEKRDGTFYRLDIELRAYDEGVAFRYVLPMHPEAIYHRVKAENTEFALPEGTLAWYTPWAQGRYELRPLCGQVPERAAGNPDAAVQLLPGWEDECERPVTLKIADDLWAAVGEAAQVDFPRGKLKLSEERPNTLLTALNDDGTDIVTPFNLPWRVVMAAPSAGKLLENNDIYLNLNEPSRIADESWIRPGKIMRETTLTTEGALAVIDFCAAHNMQYLLFDWLWYGPAFDFASDATKVVAPIDMPKVVEYGRERGVGIWLYVNQHALQKQAEELFPIFHEWGIAGVKFGFVQFTSQHWSEWVHRLVRLAAENHLMVNIHDEYRPTGYSRTWPNLLTQEGICGNEEFAAASHNTILPFTRMLCGAADYTVCYFDPRLVNTTHAHQLALPVIFFSPLQTLYWYDYPARIQEVEELEFFDSVPTVWDDTKVLDDEIGKHIAIARRSGEEWYVGVLNGDEAAETALGTEFLEAGKPYTAYIYTDDRDFVPSEKIFTEIEEVEDVRNNSLSDEADGVEFNPDNSTQTSGKDLSPTGVVVSRCIVRGGDTLDFNLLPGGGAAVRFFPATQDDLRKYGLYSNVPVFSSKGDSVDPQSPNSSFDALSTNEN